MPTKAKDSLAADLLETFNAYCSLQIKHMGAILSPMR